MDKTVPELAEELDINKLRIYRYIKRIISNQYELIRMYSILTRHLLTKY